jgi:hypothetical protein
MCIQPYFKVLDRSSDFTRVLDVASIREADPSTSGARNAARTRHFAQAIYLAHNLFGGLDPDLGSALASAGAIVNARNSIYGISAHEILRLTSALDFAVSRSFALALERPNDRDLARALDLKLEFDRYGNLIDDRDVDLVNNLDRAISRTSERCLGTAFSRMLASAAEVSANTDSLRRSDEIFAKGFIELTTGQHASYIVPPDLLKDISQKAVIELVHRSNRNRSAASVWSLRFLGRFESLAEMILSRKQQLTAPTARALRIMSLCLAAEADAFQAPKIGDDFRKVAAGITWIERRIAGVDEPSETIVLSTSWTL